MFVILPETKGVSLERMDKLFGEIDYVEAREAETEREETEATAYSSAMREPQVPKMTVNELVDEKRDVEVKSRV